MHSLGPFPRLTAGPGALAAAAAVDTSAAAAAAQHLRTAEQHQRFVHNISSPRRWPYAADGMRPSSLTDCISVLVTSTLGEELQQEEESKTRSSEQ